MASADLDPIFVKGLKLLLSRSKEAEDQLKQMLDEVLDQRKKEIANKSVLNIGDEAQSSSFSGKSSLNRKDHMDQAKKREREAERVNLEKLKQDIANLTEENPTKKARLDLGSSPVVSASASPRSSDGKEKDKDRTKSKTDSKDKPRERLREIEEDIFFGFPSSSLSSNRQKDAEKSEKDEKQREKPKELHDTKEEKVSQVDSGSDTEISGDDQQHNDSLEDMQFELELGNISCVVCKLFGVTSTNRLIECQECHSLYHQECHKPVVTDNVNDPRFVWYCSKCTKNLKKIVTKTTNKKAKTPLPLNSRESPVGRVAPKSDSNQIQQPFKRLEQPIKATSSKDNGNSASASSNGQRLGGLAGLAANYSKSSSSLDSSKMSKSDSASRLGQANSSSHLTLAPRPDASKVSLSDGSLKSASAKVEPPFKAPHNAKGDSSKTSGAFGLGGQSKVSGGKPATSSTASSSSSSGTTTKMSQSSFMSADKRLQMMKKQAAKKSSLK